MIDKRLTDDVIASHQRIVAHSDDAIADATLKVRIPVVLFAALKHISDRLDTDLDGDVIGSVMLHLAAVFANDPNVEFKSLEAFVADFYGEPLVKPDDQGPLTGERNDQPS